MPRGKPFQRGHDPRRHRLSKQDCAKGFAAAPAKIRSRIRSLYRKHGKKWPATPVNLETWPQEE